MAPKSQKKKSSDGNGAKDFLTWHGEKLVMPVIVIAALWIALQGLGYLGQPLPFQPEELERIARETETAIGANDRGAETEGVEIPNPDHAERASQIRTPINAEPYAVGNWNPAPEMRQQQRSAASSWD